MDEVVAELAGYSSSVADSLDTTSFANDRSCYRDQLAAAARWLGMIHRGASLAELRDAVAVEQRRVGLGYLSGESGKNATEALVRFVSFLDSRLDRS